MLWLIKTKSSPHWWLTDWLTKRNVNREDAGVAIFVTTVTGNPISTADGGGPHVLGDDQQDVVDRIPVVG